MIINKDSKMGCHCWGTVKPSVDAIVAFTDIGCKWLRVTRPFQIDVVAKGNGVYDFANNGEDSVDKAISNGMTILGILDGRWGHETNINKLPWCSPIWDNLEIWEDYVKQTVEYYKDRVKYWEVINEPPFFWLYPTKEGEILPDVKPPLKRAPIEKYALLLKSTAKVIRKIDSSAKILIGSTFPDGDFLKELYKHGCKDYFDIVSVHYLPCKNHFDFRETMLNLREIMELYEDQEKPIWDTENGSFGAIVGNAVETPGEYEAFYNIYRHCFSYEFNLERYFWFNQIEDDISNTYLSVYKPDGQYSDRYNSIKILSNLIGDGILFKSKHIKEDVHLYVFEGAKDKVSIVWSTAPAKIAFISDLPGIDLQGDDIVIPQNTVLDARPFYFIGDLENKIVNVEIIGKRQAINACTRQPDEDTKSIVSNKVIASLNIDSLEWDAFDYAIKKENMTLYPQNNSGYLQPDSVLADLKIAHNKDTLFIKVKSYDCENTGLVQFSMKDSNESVVEWPYFFNGYSVMNLFASKNGNKVLRYSSLFIRDYPSGEISNAKITTKADIDGLTVFVSIPFSEIGPCKVGANNPFLLMFTFTKTNNLLDVPIGDSPQEWGNNFMDIFICRKSPFTAWVEFD